MAVSSLGKETEQPASHGGWERRDEWFHSLVGGTPSPRCGESPASPLPGPASSRAGQTRALGGRRSKCWRTRNSSERKWRSGRFLKRRRHAARAASAESNPATARRRCSWYSESFNSTARPSAGSPARVSAALRRSPPLSTSARKPRPLSRCVTVLRSHPSARAVACMSNPCWRRQAEHETLQAEVEVLPEPALRDSALEVPVAGGDDPNVHRGGTCRPDPVKGLVLKHAEKLALVLGPQLADFVKEDRPAIGLLEVPSVLRDGAREASLHVAEQLALEQLGRNRGHVHRDERPAGARAQAVGRPREQLLARPRLAEDEDRQGRTRRLLQIPEPRQHPRIAGHDGDLRTLSPQAVLLRVVELHLSRVGGSQLALQVAQLPSRLLLLRPRLPELPPQRLRGLQQLALGAARSRHRGARRLEVFFQRLDGGLLAHQSLANLPHLAFEVPEAIGGAELVPCDGAGARHDHRAERQDRR